ncbi:hypothetical protein L7F22_016378 [Adiantum nelumboides]|nr:hypothetical protein [Adiantum nelumboides]
MDSVWSSSRPSPDCKELHKRTTPSEEADTKRGRRRKGAAWTDDDGEVVENGTLPHGEAEAAADKEYRKAFAEPDAALQKGQEERGEVKEVDTHELQEPLSRLSVVVRRHRLGVDPYTAAISEEADLADHHVLTLMSRATRLGAATINAGAKSLGITQLTDEADRNKVSGVQAEVESDSVRVTWLGHATTLVQFPGPGGLNVLFDPIFVSRASPSQAAGPIRYTEPPCSIDELPRIDVVCISHNHYDHLSADCMRQLREREMERQLHAHQQPQSSPPSTPGESGSEEEDKLMRRKERRLTAEAGTDEPSPKTRTAGAARIKKRRRRRRRSPPKASSGRQDSRSSVAWAMWASSRTLASKRTRSSSATGGTKSASGLPSTRPSRRPIPPLRRLLSLRKAHRRFASSAPPPSTGPDAPPLIRM